MKLYISIKTKEQLEAAAGRADALIVPAALAESAKESGKEVFLDLPEVCRENKAEGIKREIETSSADGVVIKNADELGLITSMDYKGKVIFAPSLYAYNPKAVRLLSLQLPNAWFIFPDELTDDESKALQREVPEIGFIYKIYGKQLLMTTAQNMNRDFAGGGAAHFKNNKNEAFCAVHDDGQDHTLIYNEVPTSMIDKKDELPWDDLLIEFTTEDKKQCEAVLAGRVGSFTRGHHYKGVE